MSLGGRYKGYPNSSGNLLPDAFQAVVPYLRSMIQIEYSVHNTRPASTSYTSVRLTPTGLGVPLDLGSRVPCSEFEAAPLPRVLCRHGTWPRGRLRRLAWPCGKWTSQSISTLPMWIAPCSGPGAFSGPSQNVHRSSAEPPMVPGGSLPRTSGTASPIGVVWRAGAIEFLSRETPESARWRSS
jgi:hypothetical protein